MKTLALKIENAESLICLSFLVVIVSLLTTPIHEFLHIIVLRYYAPNCEIVNVQWFNSWTNAAYVSYLGSAPQSAQFLNSIIDYTNILIFMLPLLYHTIKVIYKETIALTSFGTKREMKVLKEDLVQRMSILDARYSLPDILRDS